jgi:hypothetical protein
VTDCGQVAATFYVFDDGRRRISIDDADALSAFEISLQLDEAAPEVLRLTTLAVSKGRIVRFAAAKLVVLEFYKTVEWMRGILTTGPPPKHFQMKLAQCPHGIEID